MRKNTRKSYAKVSLLIPSIICLSIYFTMFSWNSYTLSCLHAWSVKAALNTLGPSAHDGSLSITRTYDLYFDSTFRLIVQFWDLSRRSFSPWVKDSLLLFLLQFRPLRSQSQTSSLESPPEMFSGSERWYSLVQALAHSLLLVWKFQILLYMFWQLYCWQS